MNIIKNIKYDIYKFAPITVNCNNYSKLLDVDVKLTINGLKLDVSYLEDSEEGDSLKRYHFLIKKIGDYVSEEGYTFYKMFNIVVSDSIERYYLFYREEIGNEENRQVKLSQLGI